MQRPVSTVPLLIRPTLSSLRKTPELPPALGSAHLAGSTRIRSRSRSTSVNGTERSRPSVRAGTRSSTFPKRLERMGRDGQGAIPTSVETGRPHTRLPAIRGRPACSLFSLIGLDTIGAREQRVRLPRRRMRFAAARVVKGLGLFRENSVGDLFRGDIRLLFVGARKELDAVRPSQLRSQDVSL
jgi:hypothetical protein